MVDGFRFASQAEARRYHVLVAWGIMGLARNLELQPRFPLVVNGVKVGTYVGDFRYEALNRYGGGRVGWVDIIEDVKGIRLPIYKLKKRMVEAQYGIQIREVR